MDFFHKQRVALVQIRLNSECTDEVQVFAPLEQSVLHQLNVAFEKSLYFIDSPKEVGSVLTVQFLFSKPNDPLACLYLVLNVKLLVNLSLGFVFEVVFQDFKRTFEKDRASFLAVYSAHYLYRD